jgi:hypothetical protein
LERVYEEKKRKYAGLARNLKRLRKGQVRVTAVIVSSMGAVYDKSLKDLQKVLGCTDREMKKLGRKMSEAVISGSMEIWRRNAKEFREETSEEAYAVIDEEVRQIAREELEEERSAIEEMNSGREEDAAEDFEEDEADEADEFEPEGGHEDVAPGVNPGYIIDAEAEAKAETEAEMEAEVGNVVEAEREVEDRRERNPEEYIGAGPEWRGRRRRGGRGKGRRRRRQQLREIDDALQLESQERRMEGIGRVVNPADDEESMGDDAWG